jgi:hypothetical protein
VAALGPRQDRFAGPCRRSVDLVKLRARPLLFFRRFRAAHAASRHLVGPRFVIRVHL